MTTADMLRQYSWVLILIVMVIYLSISILKRWLTNRQRNRNGNHSNNLIFSPEKRMFRMRLLSFFAILAIISFTLIAIINSF